MPWGLSVACRIYFKSPLLSMEQECLAVLDLDMSISLIVKFVCVVDVLGVDFVAGSYICYRVLSDLRLNWKKVPSLY